MWSIPPKWMHADHENLTLWYLSIWRFDLGTGHIVTIVRILRSFLWYEMNDLMHEMKIWFLGTQNDYFGHLPGLNYGCKIECLQVWTCMRLYVGTKLDDTNKHTKTHAWTYRQRCKDANKAKKAKQGGTKQAKRTQRKQSMSSHKGEG